MGVPLTTTERFTVRKPIHCDLTLAEAVALAGEGGYVRRPSWVDPGYERSLKVQWVKEAGGLEVLALRDAIAKDWQVVT